MVFNYFTRVKRNGKKKYEHKVKEGFHFACFPWRNEGLRNTNSKLNKCPCKFCRLSAFSDFFSLTGFSRVLHPTVVVKDVERSRKKEKTNAHLYVCASFFSPPTKMRTDKGFPLLTEQLGVHRDFAGRKICTANFWVWQSDSYSPFGYLLTLRGNGI